MLRLTTAATERRAGAMLNPGRLVTSHAPRLTQISACLDCRLAAGRVARSGLSVPHRVWAGHSMSPPSTVVNRPRLNSWFSSQPRLTSQQKSARHRQAAESAPKASADSGSPAAASDPPSAKAQPAVVTHEDIYTIPNFLTFTRLVAAPIVGYLVLHDQHAWAIGLFAYAGVTDLLDGWIARRWNRRTVVGTVIDPMADKTLMTVLTVCLAVKGALPIWVATIILGRDVGLGVAAIYYRWISLPPPKTFRRYWDFSLPSAEVRPTTISKYNTFLQLALVGSTTAAPLFGADLSAVLSAMQYVVAATTVWSGASYIYSKDAVKILDQNKSKNKDT